MVRVEVLRATSARCKASAACLSRAASKTACCASIALAESSLACCCCCDQANSVRIRASSMASDNFHKTLTRATTSSRRIVCAINSGGVRRIFSAVPRPREYSFAWSRHRWHFTQSTNTVMFVKTDLNCLLSCARCSFDFVWNKLDSSKASKSGEQTERTCESNNRPIKLVVRRSSCESPVWKGYVCKNGETFLSALNTTTKENSKFFDLSGCRPSDSMYRSGFGAQELFSFVPGT
mmetsp:Transcript_83198/g.240361  ORF Transcript_83198/g.240361 Transcript_83198/m.240361 type:complete len:236 (-) Transcript_83198:927-1634(-)